MMIKLIWAARDAELSAALLAESFVQVPSVVHVPLKLVLFLFFLGAFDSVYSLSSIVRSSTIPCGCLAESG